LELVEYAIQAIEMKYEKKEILVRLEKLGVHCPREAQKSRENMCR
jgi:hypothetical protein